MTDEQARAVLEAAWESGIRYFDTAPHYGLGLSERRLGAFLATKPRAEFVVSTKVGRLLRPSPETADRLDDDEPVRGAARRCAACGTSAPPASGRSLEESLERLGLDRSRRRSTCTTPTSTTSTADLSTGVPGAGRAPRRGPRRRDRDRLEVDRGAARRRAHGRARPRHGRRPLHAARAAGAGRAGRGVPRERGVGIVAAAVYNSGPAATAAPASGRRYEYGAVPDDAARARARALADVCVRHGVTLPEAALQFPLREPAVRSVVVGARDADAGPRERERAGTKVPSRSGRRCGTRG